MSYFQANGEGRKLLPYLLQLPSSENNPEWYVLGWYLDPLDGYVMGSRGDFAGDTKSELWAQR